MGYRKIALTLIAFGVLACGAGSLRGVALSQDLPTLRRAVADAQKSGTLDAEQERELALAVAEREIATAEGDAAVARLREVTPCLGALKYAVKQRAESADSAASATATLALIEAGYSAELSWLPERLRTLADSAAGDASWRAVKARLLSGAAAERRTAWFLDPDLRVRRAALRAALSRPELTELPSLLDVARLDPDIQARGLAVRALAKLKDARAVVGLSELWNAADDSIRQLIVEAWVELLSVGGSQHLAAVLGGEAGLPRVLAAARALNITPFHAQASDVLKHAIEGGSLDEQVLALRLAPAAAELVPVFEKRAAAGASRARVAAIAVLLQLPKQRQAAMKQLKTLQRDPDVIAARQVTALLASAGDVSVLTEVSAELKAKQPANRVAAAVQLIDLGRRDLVVESLTDDVASVRTQVACALLSR